MKHKGGTSGTQMKLSGLFGRVPAATHSFSPAHGFSWTAVVITTSQTEALRNGTTLAPEVDKKSWPSHGQMGVNRG